MARAKPPADTAEKPKLLLVPLGTEDHALVADYAAANALPTIEAGAARIIGEWAGRQRIRDQARKRRR